MLFPFKPLSVSSANVVHGQEETTRKDPTAQRHNLEQFVQANRGLTIMARIHYRAAAKGE